MPKQNKACSVVGGLCDRTSVTLVRCIELILAIAVLLLNWLMLEYSTSSRLDVLLQFFTKNYIYLALNLATLLVWFFVWMIVLRRTWRGILCATVLDAIVSLVNYYTIRFHGSPFSYYEIKNIATALNVADGYDLTWNRKVLLLILLAVLALCLAIAGKLIADVIHTSARKIWIDACMCVFGICVMFFGYLSGNPIKPIRTIAWSWKEAYAQYGYVACTIETYIGSKNIIIRPSDYSQDKLKEAMEELHTSATEEAGAYAGESKKPQPDLIIILNESLYDLELVTDLQADADVMEDLYDIAGLEMGYAHVPYIGGQTNCSEYELLTSNSVLGLTKGVTPFNVLDLKGANSIVSVLKEQGYTSIAAHSESGLNYARLKGYNDLGFDRVYFEEDFKEVDYYNASSFETDASLYKNMLRFYEDAVADDPQKPVFSYLLTIQNHGGYGSMDPEAYLVHAGSDYGEYDSAVDEYLTDIKLSWQAFRELTEYLASSEREVYVLMMGDHCPIFADEIADKDMAPDELEELLKSTPYVLWSNKKGDAAKLDFKQEKRGGMAEYSMIYMAPMLLEDAGLKQSQYYRYINVMRKSTPIITGMESPYFTLEYNNLMPEIRNDELFKVLD